jgi:hypothetical protein
MAKTFYWFIRHIGLPIWDYIAINKRKKGHPLQSTATAGR